MVLQMTDKDVVDRAAKIIVSSVWYHKSDPPRKDVWACGAAGLRAIEWMRIIRPYLGIRRQEQIVKTVQGWLASRKYNKKDELWWSRMFRLEVGRI